MNIPSREKKDLNAALVLLELLSLVLRATHEARRRACVALFAPFVTADPIPRRAPRRLSLRGGQGNTHRPGIASLGRSPGTRPLDSEPSSRALLGARSSRRPRSGFLPGLRLRLKP